MEREKGGGFGLDERSDEGRIESEAGEVNRLSAHAKRDSLLTELSLSFIWLECFRSHLAVFVFISKITMNKKTFKDLSNNREIKNLSIAK